MELHGHDTRPTVWLVNDAGHDTADAEKRFGPVRPLSIGNTNPLNVDRALWSYARGIARYTKRDDYLCIMGTPALNCFAIMLWMLMHRQCRLLQWHAIKRRYQLRVITYEHLVNLLDAAMNEHV